MHDVMPFARRGAVIAGVGAYLPSRVVTNAELTNHLDTSDEWIRSRTGVRTRHFVAPGEATSDLAVAAAVAALDSGGGTGAGVDMVILATATPDHHCPATAPLVAARLGLPGVPAFDIAAVCSGFLYGLAVADAMLAGGGIHRVLLIGADTFSTIVDPADRTTAVVFGDGAGAVVLRAGDRDEPGAVLSVELGSDGNLSDLIGIRAGGSRRPARSEQADPADLWFAMQGQAVYRHAVTRMIESSRSVMSRVGWAPGDVDCFVGHQANRRILDTVGVELGLAAERVYANVGEVGNTAAASIPLALAHAAAGGSLGKEDRVVLSAFGGGATWGAAALTWPALTH